MIKYSNPKDIKFSIDEYDYDGDITDEGIFLHFGDTRVKVAENKEDFYTIVERMEIIVQQIKDYY